MTSRFESCFLCLSIPEFNRKVIRRYLGVHHYHAQDGLRRKHLLVYNVFIRTHLTCIAALETTGHQTQDTGTLKE